MLTLLNFENAMDFGLTFVGVIIKHVLMFELSKKILEKVSFDKALFRKELRKAINWVRQDEKILLKIWCLTTFGSEYQNEILDVFSTFGF